jgi:PAS domain S-box-containing protein
MKKEKKGTPDSDHSDNWLTGGGEMGDLIRSLDWSKTPLGPLDSWSSNLKMMVRFLLANRFPLLLWWGPEFCQIYNDPYRPVLGTKHPHSMGQPASECWREIWHIIGPLVETPYRGGLATWMEDIFLEINRYGFVEETHFTIAYSPVPDDKVAGGIGGVLATVHEISEKVVGERRVTVLRDLGLRAEAKTEDEACCLAGETLSEHPKDVPFALIYLVDANEKNAQLSCRAGVQEDNLVFSSMIEIGTQSDKQLWNFAEVLRTKKSQTIDELKRKLGDAVPSGPWSDPPNQAVVTPIHSNVMQHVAGFLVVGVSSRLKLDDSYHTFIELVAGQIASGIANARAYQEEKRRAEALAELDRAKTTFFSNISHEFRTPLTLMLGPIEDILSAQTLSAEVHERLDVAHRNSLRLLKLVNTLLDFSRIEAGRIDAVYAPVDLAKLTADLASVFRSTIERAGMDLIIDCPSLPHEVYVDNEMWEKIVLNLISNAFKFTFDGEIRVSLTATEQFAQLKISDTGIGIDENELPHIFERFHRVEGAKGRTFEGSGIGLALVQELVKLHGGTVQCESKPDKGTSFTVSIPFGLSHLPADRIKGTRARVSSATEAAVFVEEASRWIPSQDSSVQESGSQQVESTRTERTSSRILLADDNADMRDYVYRLLSPYYAVETVADGEAVLDRARKSRPDLIITDVMMPKLDGFGVLKALRADENLATIPIIFLSARAGEEARSEGMEAGADDYLTKPFSARELLACVRAHLNLSRVRQEAETSMRESKERFSLLFEKSAFAVTLSKLPDGILIDVNEAFVKLFGYTKEEAIGKRISELNLNRDLDIRHSILTDLIESGSIQDREIKLFTKSGDARFFLCNFTVIELQGEKHVLSTLQDITDRKKAEERIELLNRISELSRNAPDVNSLMIDAVEEIGRHFKISRCLFNETNLENNREIVLCDYFKDVPSVVGEHELSDYSSITAAEMMDGKTVVNFNSELDSRTAADYARTYGPQEERSYVAVPLMRDKRWVATLWASDKVPREWTKEEVALLENIAGRVWAAVEKIRSDNDLLESQKKIQSALISAEEANRIKDEFLATISHELRTPLNTILGWAHVLQSKTSKGPKTTSAIDAIYTSAKNQAQIVDDLLDVSRIISGKMKLRPEIVLLSEILLASVNAVSHPISAKNINLRIQFTNETEDICLYGDAQRLQQVFWNLLSNAVKFTPQDGSIEILVERSLSEVNVCVQDTGMGIPPEFLTVIFERFRQVDSSTTRKFGGIGLGLSIAKHLVELHGGAISVESKGPGSGAKFIVTLPLTHVQTQEGEHPQTQFRSEFNEAAFSSLSGKRILLVDDDPDTLKLVAEFFDSSLAELRTATSAKEGFETLNHWKPDLVISDIAMPDNDGYWLIEQVRTLSSEMKHIPAVALTAYASVTDREKVLAAGYQMFVPKPVVPLELLKTVKELLNREAFRLEKLSSLNLKQTSPQNSIPNLAATKVLLVEDDLLSTDVFRYALEQKGFEFRSASKASDALEILKDWHPDVIVSDLGLPDEDGYSLIKKIRMLPDVQKAQIPAIALTGYGVAEGRAAVSAGFQIFKSKPIDPDTLVSVVKELTKCRQDASGTKAEITHTSSNQEN